MNKVNPDKKSRLDPGDIILTLLVWCITLVLFGRTVTPGLLPGDGGEFQTLAYLYGHTHPTGYPVYLTLARIFSFLPLGDLPYRVNLFSAVMAAVAVTSMYISGRLLTNYRAVPAAVALSLAVSPTFWSQAVIAEIYSTGVAFFGLILVALLSWDRFHNQWALFIAGMLGGLSLGVHMSVVLLAPAVLLLLILHRSRGVNRWKFAVAGAAIGLLITLGLFGLIDINNPTASYFNAVIEPSRSAWGLEADEIENPVDRLLFGWQGRQFQYLMFSDPPEVMPRQAEAYFENLKNEFTWPFILFAAFGIISIFQWNPRFASLTLVALATQWIFFFNYEIWDLYVFYIPSYFLLAMTATAGFGTIVEVLRKGIQKTIKSKAPSRHILDSSLAVLLAGLIIWPVFQPLQADFDSGEIPFDFDEYPEYDEFTYKVAFATVINLPENAIVFTEWDIMWPYYYVAYLEEDRADLAFIEAFPADDQENLAESMEAYIQTQMTDRPLYFDRRIPQLEAIEGLRMGPARIGPTRFFKLIRD